MPTTSKRTANQHAQQQQQPAPQDDEYDEYVYYPYYPKSVPGGGYEYIPDAQEPREYEPPLEQQYYDEPAPHNPAPMQRT